MVDGSSCQFAKWYEETLWSVKYNFDEHLNFNVLYGSCGIGGNLLLSTISLGRMSCSAQVERGRSSFFAQSEDRGFVPPLGKLSFFWRAKSLVGVIYIYLECYHQKFKRLNTLILYQKLYLLAGYYVLTQRSSLEKEARVSKLSELQFCDLRFKLALRSSCCCG